MMPASNLRVCLAFSALSFAIPTALAEQSERRRFDAVETPLGLNRPDSTRRPQAASELRRRHEAGAPFTNDETAMSLLFFEAEQDERRKPDPMDEPLISDRPDFTESTEAIPVGHFQLEAGYTFTYDREGKDRVRDHTAPQLLLRIGMAENFELRIGWDGYSYADSQFETRTRRGRRVTREDSFQGSNDLSLGFKYKIIEQDGLIPHFGVIGAISVPSGSAGVSSGDVDPELVLLWAYDITDGFSVAGNVGLAVPTDDSDRFFQTSASLSAAFALTERLGSYVEYFGFYPNAEHSDAAHTVNGGFTFLINNNFQIDWSIGVGLNEEADDFFTAVGFVWRY